MAEGPPVTTPQTNIDPNQGKIGQQVEMVTRKMRTDDAKGMRFTGLNLG